MKTVLLFVLILLISCNKNTDLGGYRENYTVENGAYKIDTIAFKNFIHDLPKSINKEKGKLNKKLTFQIKHSDRINLKGTKILIALENKYIYFGDYKEDITLNIGYDHPYYAGLRFYIIDYNEKTIN